jgi:deoxyribonuclease IV
VAGGIGLAFERAGAYGAKSFQVFTKNARGWAAKPIPESERALFRREARRTGLPGVAHGSYLLNLGTEDPILREKSLACLREELTRCERLGIPFLVIHPGGNADEARGLRLIARALDEVHTSTLRFRAQICLEVTAGQGNTLGWRFEHLAEILSKVRRSSRLGICLDTCHLFAAGYDISNRKGYEQVMKDFDHILGMDKLRCFHLNDSKKPLGCRVDRHEEIGKGFMGLGVFRWLVNDRRFEDTVGVLETPFQERYAQSIQLLESLVRS